MSEAKHETEDELRAAGKFEELLTRKEAELAATKAAYGRSVIVGRVRSEAEALGCIDLDAAVVLTNLDELKASDDFLNVYGARESLEMMKKQKPHLFKAAPKAPGPVPPPRWAGLK